MRLKIKTIVAVAMMLSFSNLFSASSDVESFYKAFTPIKEEVLDEGGYFSFSEVTSKLRDLFPLAKKCGKESEVLFEFYSLYSLVLSKNPKAFEETIHITLEMLETFKDSPLLDNATKYRAYFRLSNAYEEEEDYVRAIQYKKEFLQCFEKEPSVDADTILYQRGLLAYLYHEAGAYQEALALNLAIEKERSKNIDAYMFKIYNNVAQNYYGLKKFEEAEAYLNKRLKLARQFDDMEIELDTLFQLAVLAFERGELKKAEQLFVERVSIVKSHKLNTETLEKVQEDLDVFYEKRASTK